MKDKIITIVGIVTVVLIVGTIIWAFYVYPKSGEFCYPLSEFESKCNKLCEKNDVDTFCNNKVPFCVVEGIDDLSCFDYGVDCMNIDCSEAQI